jgi:hypothetical protein
LFYFSFYFDSPETGAHLDLLYEYLMLSMTDWLDLLNGLGFGLFKRQFDENGENGISCKKEFTYTIDGLAIPVLFFVTNTYFHASGYFT